MVQRTRSRQRPLIQDPRKIFYWRTKAGLDQNELARRANLSPQQMSAIERGTRGTSVGGLHRIAAALSCQATDLMPDKLLAAAQDSTLAGSSVRGGES